MSQLVWKLEAPKFQPVPPVWVNLAQSVRCSNLFAQWEEGRKNIESGERIDTSALLLSTSVA